MAGPNIRSVNNRVSGQRVPLPGASPARASYVVVAIADDDIMDQWENGGAVIHRIRGDGRLVLPKFNATPINPSDGDFWVQDNGGTLELHYQDGVADTIIGAGVGGAGAGGINFSLIPDTVSRPKGYAVRSRDVSGTVKTGLATAGAGSVSGELYEPIGLLALDVPASPNPPTEALRVILPGQTIELTSGQINTITGAADLVPSRTYFLSNVSGRWVLDPIGAGVEVVVPIGRALTKTTFLVDIGMPIVL